MKRKRSKGIFKPYTQNQLMLPTNLNELIPEKHLVGVVSAVIDEIHLEPLLREYKGGGTSSYHPRMMLKVLVYAYTQKEYSSRRIAKALRENINYMWLSGGNTPNFRIINRFRGVVMRTVIEDVFTEVLEYLIGQGYVKMEKYFIDGTKIEANANRYSFVWRKSTENFRKKLEEKVREMLEEVERVNAEEEESYGDKELAKRLSEKLKDKPKDKQIKKAVKKLERDFIPRMEK